MTLRPAHGHRGRCGAHKSWAKLDPGGVPTFVWITEVSGPWCVLLGAFDPPTKAHTELVRGVAAITGRTPVLCLTRVLMGRETEPMLPAELRLEMLTRLGYGLGVTNRGTYVEVANALGGDAVFIVGTDKVAQLQDPKYYEDGATGVRRTFDQVKFAIVRRGSENHKGAIVSSRVFNDPATAGISATEVRQRLAAGQPIDDLVDPAVAELLRGYTRP